MGKITLWDTLVALLHCGGVFSDTTCSGGIQSIPAWQTFRSFLEWLEQLKETNPRF